jgi:hypothetical protein
MSIGSFVDRLFGIDTSGPVNAANAQAAQIDAQQKAHDAAVAQGRSAIDTAFQPFDQNYFKGVSTAYNNYYTPQLAEQYSIGRDSLTAALAGNDTLGSTAGANAMAQLQKARDTTQSDIASRGQDAANSAQATVNNAKTNLYGLNAAAADPLMAQEQATAQTGALVSPTSYPSLGNVFGSVLSPLASAGKAQAGAPYPASYAMGPTASNATGAGSGVIN